MTELPVATTLLQENSDRLCGCKMIKHNILILSAGRRVGLVQSFIFELKRLFPHSFVLAADMNSSLSAACQIADKSINLPSIQDEKYIDTIIKVCVKEGIGIVIPTIDTDLMLLSKNRTKFYELGICLIISDEVLVGLCRDKRETPKIFDQLGISTPVIYSKASIQFPCFIKPYDGSSSVGTMIVEDWHSVSKAILQNEKIIFMELIDNSHDEYTIDAYYDKKGQLKCLVPRQRIQVRGGEISKGVTRRNEVYDYLLPKLKLLQGAIGCVTIQVFANTKRMSFFGIEVNPRFGGGYPLSYSAGANYPAWLIAEYLQDRPLPFFDRWEADLLMLRYDTHTLCHGYK
jgi:carbamoyl-phosphate synthase large subunit